MSKAGYLNFRVDPEQLAELERLAKMKGYKVSQLARMCLRQGLKLAPDFPQRQTEHDVRAKAVAA
jgi:hypothetical protein